MTYKKTTSTLAIAVIGALMVSASVVIALAMITEGVGPSHAGAKLLRLHFCGKNPQQQPPCNIPKIRPG